MKVSRTFYTLTLVLTGVFYSMTSVAAPVQERFYNPKPLADDVIVSMPCEQSMVFRKIYTSYDDKKIKDKAFRAGSSDSVDVVSESTNNRYIQGSMHDSKGYYYLMAKYELTELQYKALTSDKCPKPSPKMVRPAVNISYFDAMNAANAYSLYLQKAKDAPKSGNQIAYARMPTDSEFEFASRGGLEVSASEFDASLPKFDGELNDYVVFAGSQSSNGKLAAIGQRKPTVLGLHDIFGNAGEMVLEPFRATRTGRLHGGVGGFIVRGGSFTTKEADISSAYRKERAFYVKGAENKAPDTSTRFVLGVGLISDVNENRELAKEIASLGNDSDKSDTKGGNLQTVKKLESIISENTKKFNDLSKSKDSLEDHNKKLTENLKSLSSELKDLKQAMIEANTLRDEMRDKAIVSNLQMGAMFCNLIGETENERATYTTQIPRFEKRVAQEPDDQNSRSTLLSMKGKLKRSEALLSKTVDYYGSFVVSTEQTYDLPIFKAQEKNAKGAFGKTLDDYINQYLSDVESYSKDKKKDLKKNEQKWIDGCFRIVEKKNAAIQKQQALQMAREKKK